MPTIPNKNLFHDDSDDLGYEIVTPRERTFEEQLADRMVDLSAFLVKLGVGGAPFKKYANELLVENRGYTWGAGGLSLGISSTTARCKPTMVMGSLKWNNIKSVSLIDILKSSKK